MHSEVLNVAVDLWYSFHNDFPCVLLCLSDLTEALIVMFSTGKVTSNKNRLCNCEWSLLIRYFKVQVSRLIRKAFVVRQVNIRTLGAVVICHGGRRRFTSETHTNII